MENYLQLVNKPNKTKQLKLIFKTLDTNTIIETISMIDEQKCDEETKLLLHNKDLLRNCIEFRKGNNSLNVKKYNGAFNNLLKECFNQKLFSKICETEEVMEKGYDDFVDYYPILVNCDIEMIEAKLFSNPEIFEELKKIFSKYKMFSWNETFDKLLSNCDYDYDSGFKANLINYGYLIIEALKTKSKNSMLIDILDEVMITCSVSNIYMQLFGREDFIHLSNNKAPNAGHSNKEERMKLATEYYNKSYSRTKIPVPPIDKKITLENGKKIQGASHNHVLRNLKVK